MAFRLWLLLTTVSLLSTATCMYDLDFQLYLNDDFNRVMQLVINILWSGFDADIKSDRNVLFFTIPSAIDVDFMIQALDKDLKSKALRTLPLYEGFQFDLKIGEERLTDSDMHFKTIFVGNFDEMFHRMLIGPAFEKLSKLSDRFQLILNNNSDSLRTKSQRLLSKVIETGLAELCGARYCDYPTILYDNAPFSILTFASWNITEVDGFMWVDYIEFALYGTTIAIATSLRSVANHDYAEFKYSPQNACTGKVLRLPYKQNFSLFFVIQSTEKACGSAEDLWKGVQNVNLGRMTFSSKPVSVTIPYFRVSANSDLRKKLGGTALREIFDQESSRLYRALYFQAAEVIFKPPIPRPRPKLAIPIDTALVFKAERPFIFALYHKIIQVPIFAGLINNPVCIVGCAKHLVQ